MWELDYKESWGLKNWCFWTVVLEKTLESSLDCKEIIPVHPKEISPEYSLEGWCWSWSSNTLATWCEELTHWKRPWCWERLKAGGEGDNRGWNGWMASPTRWTWVCASSRSWWWTGSPGMLQSIVSQRVGHDWATELNWINKTSPVNLNRFAYKWWLTFLLFPFSPWLSAFLLWGVWRGITFYLNFLEFFF